MTRFEKWKNYRNQINSSCFYCKYFNKVKSNAQFGYCTINDWKFNYVDEFGGLGVNHYKTLCSKFEKVK